MLIKIWQRLHLFLLYSKLLFDICINKHYNKSNPGTCFSIGIGSNISNRKNAVEVKQNGDVYIVGIGGFTGANSDSSKSVQEVINELVNKLNEITTND